MSTVAAITPDSQPVEDEPGLIDAGVWVVCDSCLHGVPADDVETCPWHGYQCSDCRENKSLCKRSCYGL